MTAALALTGMKFARLTVLGRAIAPGVSKKSYWSCRCECGSISVVAGADLKNGATKSCGCLKLSLMRVATLRHGRTGTKTHNIWKDMLRRCQDEKRAEFAHYGGRGIKVCRRWQTFENFLADMGECPAGYSIERIRVNRGYCRSNCKWLPRRLQSRNQRRTIRVGGVPLAQLCEEKGLRYGLVYDRIKRLGWTPKEALRA